MFYSEIIEKCKEIDTNSLLALCEIENYDMFCKELEELISSSKLNNSIYTMYRIMQGKITLGNKKFKDFVKKYQDIIETMKKYHCLSNMTIARYDYFGKIIPGSTDDYFFKFITNHKDELETIKNVVTKIKELGFSKITYNEEFDFTNTECVLDNSYKSDFAYLENMEIVPTYGNNLIKYKTTDSCYCMTIDTLGYGHNMRISDYGRDIYLNSLIFDSNRLPDEITFESTYGVITKLAEESKQEGKTIKELVDMSVAIDDLICQYNKIEKTIEVVESVKTKDELKQILNNILEEINKLKSANLSFEQEAINVSSKLDSKKIEEEKQLYLKRRQDASIHDCWY